MDYHAAANFLFDLRRFRSKPGLKTVTNLLDHLDNPQDGPAYIQIAGSNGKGSTATMLASILDAAGLDVGLYISPHLDDIRERIRINGRKIPKTAITEYVEAIEDYVTDEAATGTPPTFFEVLTGMGLWHFGTQGVDVAVLEVGLGGRYDATSVIDPVASTVTSVSLEHTDVLGDTIEEIAEDKATVAPADRPLVTAATGDALDAIRESAGDVVTVGEGGDVSATYQGRTDNIESAVTIDGPDWHVETPLSLLGAHQARNAAIAAVLARQVADVETATIGRGIRQAEWPGRFEVMNQSPLTVLDGAHNPGACEALTETLQEFSYDRLHLVFGAMHDKDIVGMVEALPTPERVIATRANLDRAEEKSVIARVFERHGADTVETVAAVESAVEKVLSTAGPEDCVLIAGSLAVVSEARMRWTRREIPKRVRTIEDARDVLAGSHVTDPGVWRMRGKGVHRVVKTRVQPRQAQYLKEEMLSLGGECGISGLNDQDEENLDIVLMGTLSQFKRLIEKLDAQPYGLSVFAEDLREGLDIQTAPPDHGYPWEDGTAIMGILNVTPDSFHDGGEYDAAEDAIDRAETMAAAGADIIDIGGESTRPGADPVTVAEERDRVVPVIEELATSELDAMLSVDTRKAAVAEAAIEAGIDILNDVSGLDDPEMRLLAAEYDIPVVVAHSIDTPVDPDRTVTYDDVVEDVLEELDERVLRAEKAGLDRSKIIADPGLGFGKNSAESFELLGRLGEFEALGCPVMVGHSHKSMFDLLGYGADEREHATVAATALAADRGADIVRVHDIPENVAAIRAVMGADDPSGLAVSDGQESHGK
ncbi:MAG: dihydropteroate synthase [Halobacteriales archaeon]